MFNYNNTLLDFNSVSLVSLFFLDFRLELRSVDPLRKRDVQSFLGHKVCPKMIIRKSEFQSLGTEKNSHTR